MKYFHSFDELDITGARPAAQLEAEAEVVFGHGVTGKEGGHSHGAVVALRVPFCRLLWQLFRRTLAGSTLWRHCI